MVKPKAKRSCKRADTLRWRMWSRCQVKVMIWKKLIVDMIIRLYRLILVQQHLKEVISLPSLRRRECMMNPNSTLLERKSLPSARYTFYATPGSVCACGCLSVCKVRVPYGAVVAASPVLTWLVIASRVCDAWMRVRHHFITST